MNERIEELMKQAMEPSGLESLGGPYMELNPEKFAELIVKECIHAVEDTNDRYRKKYFADRYRKECFADRYRKEYFANQIRNHFGVK